MKNLNEGFVPTFVIVGIVVLVGIIGIGGAYIGNKQKSYSPSMNSQSVEQNDSKVQDWKVYNNEEFGFELEYPQQWKYEFFEDKKSVDAIVFTSPNQYSPSLLRDGFHIRIVHDERWKENMDTEGVVKKVLFGKNVLESEWYPEFQPNKDVPFIKTIQIVTNPVIQIEMVAYSVDSKKIEDAILSTFKFTR